MLLVIDVGNTNITLGAFRGDELLGTYRMTTKQPRTSDEYGITLKELVEHQGVSSMDINAVIIASVVPDVMHSLGSAIIKYFGVKPIVVSAGIKTGIRIVTENPRQVGSDRIVDAVAAYTLHGGTGYRGRLRNCHDIRSRGAGWNLRSCCYGAGHPDLRPGDVGTGSHAPGDRD